MLLVILCFPKLVATCLAVFLRMVVRLLVAIVVRVFRAAWFELDGALGSLAGLSLHSGSGAGAAPGSGFW